MLMMAFRSQSYSILRTIIAQTSRIDTRNIKRWVSPTLRELKRRKDRYVAPKEQPRSVFLEWNFDTELYAFGKRLNETFDKTLLQQALTHKLYLIKEEITHENDNTSLIRDGEKFINASVKQQLSEALPKFPAEGVDEICRYLTTNDSLANVALHIGLKDLILCAEYPPETATISDTFKAVISALVSSSDEKRAYNFVYDFVVLRQLEGKDVNEIWNVEKPLEMLSKLLKSDLEPRLCNQSGSNTILAAHQVGLYSDKQCVGLGWGESITIAIEMAAKDGLKRVFNTTDSMPPITAVQSCQANMRT